MLRIIGSVHQTFSYDRIPMHDGAGPVTAYVHPGYVHYRPLGGTKMGRLARAQVIAAEQGGVVILHGIPENPSRHHHLALVKFGPHAEDVISQ